MARADFTSIVSVLVAVAAVLAGCASRPVRPVAAVPAPVETAAAESDAPAGPEPPSPTESATQSPAKQIVALALSQLGAPYRYGGTTPAGFDCSGLVTYTYGQAGILVPRTAEQQHRIVRPLSLAEAGPGDLLFFRLAGKISHVAIYLGDGQFVHAPGSGRTVERASLASAYFRDRMIGAGRAPGL